MEIEKLSRFFNIAVTFLSENWKSYNILKIIFSKGTISKTELILIRNSNRSNNIIVLANCTSGYATESYKLLNFVDRPAKSSEGFSRSDTHVNER